MCFLFAVYFSFFFFFLILYVYFLLFYCICVMVITWVMFGELYQSKCLSSSDSLSASIVLYVDGY